MLIKKILLGAMAILLISMSSFAATITLNYTQVAIIGAENGGGTSGQGLAEVRFTTLFPNPQPTWNFVYIDLGVASGKAMYATFLAAYVNGSTVTSVQYDSSTFMIFNVAVQ